MAGGFQFAAMPPSAGKRPRSATVQARVGKEEARCSACDITYRIRLGQKAHCPLCEMIEINDQLRDKIFELTNAQNMVLNDLDRAKSEIDNLHAMKSALDTISTDDLVWVKAALYRWQSDRQRVTIRPLHGEKKGKRRGRAPVTGFILFARDVPGGHAEERICDSIGGIALAGYLEEATALVGQVKAVECMARAVMSRMTGDVG